MKVSSMKLVAALMVTVWLLFALPNPDKAVAAVQTSSSITLNVYDSRESPVYDAKVVISSTSLPFPITLHSNQYGVASITYLPAGEYNMEITAFQKSVVTSPPIQLNGTYTHTVTLEDKYSTGIENFTAVDNSYTTLDKFTGFVTFNKYGEVPLDTTGRLAFYNDNDDIVGTPFKSDITINTNGYNSINIPTTSIPTGATKIGIELVSGQNQDNLVAKQTKKMWKQKFYEPMGAEFIDSNSYGDAINGSLKWYGASDETGIAGYSIFYVIINSDHTTEEHFIGAVATRADKSYQISIPALPDNVSNLWIKAVLQSGEEVGFPKQILISDNRLSDTVTNIMYSLSLPVPNLLSTYINYTSPTTIQGSLVWTINPSTSQLKGQSIYFVDAIGNKIQPIRTIKLPRFWTLSYTDFTEPLTVPNGATRLAVYTVSVDGEESSPAYYTLPTYIPYQPPYNPNVFATHLKFQDWDATAGRIHGYLTWNKATNETEISGYYAFFAGTGVQRTPIGQVTKGSPMTLEISPSTPVPQGVTEIQVIVYKTIDGVAHLAPSWSVLSLNDYSTEEQVKSGLKYNYFTGITAIDIKQILLTLNNPSNPFSQISKEDTQVLLSLIKPTMSAN